MNLSQKNIIHAVLFKDHAVDTLLWWRNPVESTEFRTVTWAVFSRITLQLSLLPSKSTSCSFSQLSEFCWQSSPCHLYCLSYLLTCHYQFGRSWSCQPRLCESWFLHKRWRKKAPSFLKFFFLFFLTTFYQDSSYSNWCTWFQNYSKYSHPSLFESVACLTFSWDRIIVLWVKKPLVNCAALSCT